MRFFFISKLSKDDAFALQYVIYSIIGFAHYLGIYVVKDISAEELAAYQKDQEVFLATQKEADLETQEKTAKKWLQHSHSGILKEKAKNRTGWASCVTVKKYLWWEKMCTTCIKKIDIATYSGNAFKQASREKYTKDIG